MGLIAVQTYTADHRYDQADLDVLAFVGRHIGAALDPRSSPGGDACCGTPS